MAKIDKAVKRETAYVAISTFILGMLTQAVFLIIKKWDYTVLLGNILSWALGFSNFFLMGLTVQKALGKEEKEARNLMKSSQIYRQLLILLIAVVGIILPYFSIWTVLIPLLFPRIVISFRPLFNKSKAENTGSLEENSISGDGKDD